MADLGDFVRESNAIEGITRRPTAGELAAAALFMESPATIGALCAVQAAFAPGRPLRDRAGMDVRVGRHVPPPGGSHIPQRLRALLRDMGDDPWETHCRFEGLHPYMDGNGRTGRILWARHMRWLGRDPLALPFLHTWYYQTLEHVEARDD
jgi:hypothetical protein